MGLMRTREHLTEAEIERLIAAAKANRHGHRDATRGASGLSAGPTGGRTCGPALGSKCRRLIPVEINPNGRAAGGGVEWAFLPNWTVQVRITD